MVVSVCCVYGMLMGFCGCCVKVECRGNEEGVWCRFVGVFVV